LLRFLVEWRVYDVERRIGQGEADWDRPAQPGRRDRDEHETTRLLEERITGGAEDRLGDRAIMAAPGST
jgi:hypothetical protein